MFVTEILSTIFALLLALNEDVSFKNVTVAVGDELEADLIRIKYSNYLADYLSSWYQEKNFITYIKISNQDVPVLYENSLSDVSATFMTIQNVGLKEIRPGALTKSHFNKFICTNNDLEEIKYGVFNELITDSICLSDNKISRIEAKAFANIPYLANLTLTGNRLTQLNPEWFGNSPNLMYLLMEHNSIERLQSEVLRTVPSLIVLSLSDNKISEIEPDALKGLHNLANFDIRSNNVTHIDKQWFFYVPDISYIYLGGNKIEIIPEGAFSFVYNPNIIRLGDNKIHAVDPRAFDGMKVPYDLELQNNMLTTFDIGFLNNSRARSWNKEEYVVNLTGNLITCLTGDLNSVKAQKLILKDNPLTCDCVEQLKATTNESQEKVGIVYSNTTCQS